jgi:hypothetical protein
MLGDSRDDCPDLRIAHLPGNIFAVEPDVVESTVRNRRGPNGYLRVLGNARERIFIVRSDTGSQRGKGNGPIQRASIEEQRAQAVGQHACNGGLAGGGRTVDRYYLAVVDQGTGALIHLRHESCARRR